MWRARYEVTGFPGFVLPHSLKFFAEGLITKFRIISHVWRWASRRTRLWTEVGAISMGQIGNRYESNNEWNSSILLCHVGVKGGGLVSVCDDANQCPVRIVEVYRSERRCRRKGPRIYDAHFGNSSLGPNTPPTEIPDDSLIHWSISAGCLKDAQGLPWGGLCVSKP